MGTVNDKCQPAHLWLESGIVSNITVGLTHDHFALKPINITCEFSCAVDTNHCVLQASDEACHLTVYISSALPKSGASAISQ